MGSSNRWPAMNLNMVMGCNADYRAHYSASSDSFYANLDINWELFANKITALNSPDTTPIIPWRNLALRLIHRYSTVDSRWFLSIQLCEIVADKPIPTDEPEIYNLYTLKNKPIYFHVNPDGTISDYVIGDIEGVTNNCYGKDYFENVLYQDTPTSPKRALTLGVDTQSCVLIWSEFLQLLNDNSTADRNDISKFTLVFSSCTYECDKDESLVEYPHAVCIYLNYNGIDCLENDGFVIGNFLNKAADFNTICPQRCDYVDVPMGYFQGW